MSAMLSDSLLYMKMINKYMHLKLDTPRERKSQDESDEEVFERRDHHKTNQKFHNLYKIPIHTLENQCIPAMDSGKVALTNKSQIRNRLTAQNTRKSQSDVKLGPWDDAELEPNASKIQPLNFISSSPNTPLQNKFDCTPFNSTFLNRLRQKETMQMDSHRKTNCLRCQHHKQTHQQATIDFEQSFQKQHATTPEQKLRWCLELQFMIKKRKKISNMLKMKHSGHFRSHTLNTDAICEKGCEEANSKTSSFIDEEFLSKINPQKLKNAAANISAAKPCKQHHNITQQHFLSIHSSRNNDYAGFIRQKTQETSRIKQRQRRKQYTSNHKRESSSLIQNPNKISDYSNQNLNQTFRTSPKKSQPNLVLDLSPKNHRTIEQSSRKTTYEKNYENKYSPSKQSITKIGSIKDKLKRIKYFKGKNKQQYIKSLSNRKKQEITTQNQIGSQRGEEHKVGFGSYDNQITSCTINRIKYSVHENIDKSIKKTYTK